MRTTRWLKSAAGICDSILIIIFLVLIYFAFNIDRFGLSVSLSNFIENILLGIATNLIGIIITISFVQFFLDKQSKAHQINCEKEEIKRYDRVMSCLIDKYIIAFNDLTTPVNQKSQIDFMAIKQNFNFSELGDLYKPAANIFSGYNTPTIEFFYEIEIELRNYMVQELQHLNFTYNQRLNEILTKFVQYSYNLDMHAQIIENRHVTFGHHNPPQYIGDVVGNEIKSRPDYWVHEYESNKLQGNIMRPYLILYNLLKVEILLIKEYKDYINIL